MDRAPTHPCLSLAPLALSPPESDLLFCRLLCMAGGSSEWTAEKHCSEVLLPLHSA